LQNISIFKQHETENTNNTKLAQLNDDLTTLKKSKIDQETNLNSAKKQLDDAIIVLKTQLSKADQTIYIKDKQLVLIKQESQELFDQTVSKHQSDRQKLINEIQELKQVLNKKDNEFFEFKSDSYKQIAIINEKLRQQEEQNTNAKEKLKLKDNELKTNQTNYTNKLNEIKDK